MSVVITTPDNYQTIRTISHLRRQTVRDTLEVIIVAPSLAQLELDESEMSDLASNRRITAAGCARWGLFKEPESHFVTQREYRPPPRGALASIQRFSKLGGTISLPVAAANATTTESCDN